MKIGSLLRRIPLKSRLASIAATRPHAKANRDYDCARESILHAAGYSRLSVWVSANA
jgi:hypothetical protein